MCIIMVLLIPSVAFSGDRKIRDHYVQRGNGIVYGEKTGLEWVAGPDKDTNWNQAKSWVDNLSLDGGGWRMPTRKELTILYEKDKGDHNMTPLLKTTGWCIWSGETKGSEGAWSVRFFRGSEAWDKKTRFKNRRAFAVRSRR